MRKDRSKTYFVAVTVLPEDGPQRKLEDVERTLLKVFNERKDFAVLGLSDEQVEPLTFRVMRAITYPRLSATEKEIVKLYRMGAKQTRIANDLQVSRQLVNQVLERVGEI